MTIKNFNIEKALEIVTNAVQTGLMTAEQDRALRQVQNAVNLQIEKKPMWKADKGFDFEVARRLRCPSCYTPIVSQFVRDYKPKHCSECGQKLDWSDEH